MQTDDGWQWLWGRPGGVRQTLWAQITGRFDPEAVLAAARPTPAKPVAVEDGWQALIGWDALEDGEVVETMIQGDPVAVVRRGDEVFVLDGTCPHAGGPLGEGEVRGEALVCPYHGWRFRLEDGRCVVGTADPLRVWRAERRDAMVWVKVA